MDGWANDYLAHPPQGMIVEIGAGLSTRFERLDNGLGRWFDLDLSDAMNLRKQFFLKANRRQFITASLLDTDWIDRVKATKGSSYFFIAEGVLMYFLEDQVKQLFQLLLTHFLGSTLAFDSMSPRMVNNQKHHDSIKAVKAQFVWGIRNIEQISTWSDRYQVQQVCRFSDLSKKLPPRYYRRFPLPVRFLFSLPPLRDTYRLALVRFGN